MAGKTNNGRAASPPRVRATTLEVAGIACSRAAERARGALAQAARVVVVTKFRFMGDTIVATPFLRQLRGHFPKAEITLLTSPSAAVALDHCPYLDRILSLDGGAGRWRQTQELFLRLRQGRYEAAFLLNRSLHCAVITTLAGVPMRIGYVNESRRPFLTVPIPYSFDRNEVDCHLDMLRALGLAAQDSLPDLWITDTERRRAHALLREGGWPGQAAGRPLIGVQPGSNDAPIREWGAERYAHVADILAQETGGHILIMGGEAERETADRMARAMRCPSINLTGTLELREALAIIGLCDLWLGNDTGLLHAAVAQRVASVGLFGPNKVVRWGYDTTRHRSLVVFPETPARDDATVRLCLDAIVPDLVLETARAVLSQPCSETPEAGFAVQPAEVAPSRPPYFAANLAPGTLLPARRR